MYLDANCHQLRKNLRGYVDNLLATGDRVLITRHGKPVAALVSARDLEALEKVSNNREVSMQSRQDIMMREFRTMKGVLDENG